MFRQARKSSQSCRSYVQFGTWKLSAPLKQAQLKSRGVGQVDKDPKKAPQSLGVLPNTGKGARQIPVDMRKQFVEGKMITISVEPFAGAPEVEPTGPIIALGKTKVL